MLSTTKVHPPEATLFFDGNCAIIQKQRFARPGGPGLQSRLKTRSLWNHGKRNPEVPPGLHPAFRGLCHRHRQRVEVPLYCRSGRRRRIRAVLSGVSGHSGSAHHDHGVCGGPRLPQEPGAGLSGTGKAGPEMAHPRLSHPDRLLSADDVLHHGGRLDAALFLHDRHRSAVRPERRAGSR